jgi:hypothetical protein
MKNLNCNKIILLLILHLLGLPIAVAAQTRVLRAGQKYPGPESSILLKPYGRPPVQARLPLQVLLPNAK